MIFLWLLLSVLVFEASGEEVVGLPLISSCHLLPGGNGPWIKGNFKILPKNLVHAMSYTMG